MNNGKSPAKMKYLVVLLTVFVLAVGFTLADWQLGSGEKMQIEKAGDGAPDRVAGPRVSEGHFFSIRR